MSFGPEPPSRDETVSVPNSNTIVCRPRSNAPGNKRKMFLIRNTSSDSTYIVTLAKGKIAVAGAGIVLRQNEAYGEYSESGYECWQGTINAICAVSGPATLSVDEE